MDTVYYLNLALYSVTASDQSFMKKKHVLMRVQSICAIGKLASKLVILNSLPSQASKNKDIHGDDGAKQIGKPNFNLQPPDALVDGHDDDDHEGAADGMEKHDNRIENQGPVNLQVRQSRPESRKKSQGPVNLQVCEQFEAQHL